MSASELKELNITFGNIEDESKPFLIFDERIINFLNEIHLEIKCNKSANIYPDLVTFGFWCRKVNLKKQSEHYIDKPFMIGRGKVLHITPSNVPMNFAYSFAFGLLSGNINLVRLPSKNFEQTIILCKIIKKISKKKNYNFIINRLCLFQYNRSDKISNYLSSTVDARLIWGGDETINQFRKYKVQPRCVDLNFANRHSISIISKEKISRLNQLELKNLIRKFYNDCYLMDQQGCSSPQAIIWIGKGNDKIIKKFWKLFLEYVKLNYSSDISITNKKFSLLAQSAVDSSVKFKSKYEDVRLVRLSVSNLNDDIQNINVNFGTFVEMNINDLKEIKNIFSKKSQTVTYFGVDEKKLRNFILENGISGIDRLVIVGRAHDMGHIWDGYDIVYSLSRIISN